MTGDMPFMVGLVLPLFGGWFGNASTGILYAVLGMLINVVIGYNLGEGLIHTAALPSFFFLPTVGAIVGRYRSLSYKLKVEVAQRLRIEAQMLRQQAKLLETGRFVAVAQMAGGIAHDITNPLMIIEGMVDRVRKLDAQKDQKKFDESLLRILANTQRIATVIRGVRAMAWGTEDDDIEVVDVEAMLDDVISIAKERFRSNYTELRVKNMCGTTFIKCQRLQISQVLLNLLNNSNDAVTGLRGQRWVEIDVENVNGGIQISVIDNGPGVSLEVRDKILQPFFTTKKTKAHLGLGLTLSKQILDRHGGQIFFDQKSAHTKFVVWLPLLETEAKAIKAAA
jgi:two-component system, LuxR family, sensor histidine kinase DctS